MYNLTPGTVISVPKPPFVHYGIFAFDYLSRPIVISNSYKHGKVVFESWEVFCSGYQPRIHPVQGNYSSSQIVERAIKRVGTPYSAVDYNCEHFVRDVYGITVKSPQLLGFLGLLLISGIGLVLSNRS